jgi:hypothetical protein
MIKIGRLGHHLDSKCAFRIELRIGADTGLLQQVKAKCAHKEAQAASSALKSAQTKQLNAPQLWLRPLDRNCAAGRPIAGMAADEDLTKVTNRGPHCVCRTGVVAFM